ncbi:MAG: PHP domain-containing protein [Thermoanaerobaculaceae bacterium]|nr:PHP domain-containing protein [Thermoanaerobaculaceae bacterium]
MAADLKIFRADLHIHTCLSPCADLEMSPQNIVQKSLQKKIDIIGITDHNSSKNAKGVFDAASKANLKIILGMEITTKEEVHLLGYFPSFEALNKFQKFIDKNLEKTKDKRVVENQVIANAKDEVLGFLKVNLFSAVKQPLVKIVEEIHKVGGLALPAHIEREGFGIIGQLGFFPENVKFDGVECYDRKSPLIQDVLEKYTSLTSSDAHRIEEIGKRTTLFKIKEPSFEEFEKALKRIDGRMVII